MSTIFTFLCNSVTKLKTDIQINFDLFIRFSSSKVSIAKGKIYCVHISPNEKAREDQENIKDKDVVIRNRL